MRRVSFLVANILGCWLITFGNAFTVTPSQKRNDQQQQQKNQQQHVMSAGEAASNGAGDDTIPENLVNKDAFVAAIETLKKESGIETDPEEASVPKMYAIGKLVATLPLEMAGSISLADCETLTLINGLTQQAADETGIQPLDTIVSISSGEGESGYQDSTLGANLDEVAQVYTKAIEHAMANGLKGIELEMNRLVTLQASGPPEKSD